MKKKQVQRNKTTQISISLDNDVAAWLPKAAANQRISVSRFIQGHLIPSFEARHAK